MNVNIYRFYLLLCVPCGLYIYGFFPAPYYISFLFSFCFLLFSKIKKIDKSAISILFIITFFYFIILLQSKINVWSYYLISSVSFLLIIALRKSIDIPSTQSVIRKTVIFSLSILSLDTVYRFLFPKTDYIENILSHGKSEFLFYGYKHSFLFLDSNFTALFAYSVYFLLRDNLYLFKHKKLIIFISLLIIFLTFSRAVIFTCILIETFRFLYSIKIDKKLKFVFLSFFLFLLFIISLYIQRDADESLSSKFYIFDLLFENLYNFNLMYLIFGWGIDNTRDILDIAAHSLYSTLLLETGMLGFLLITLMFFYSFIISKKTFWHFLGLAIAFLSLGMLFTPITIPLALNVMINSKDKINA